MVLGLVQGNSGMPGAISQHVDVLTHTPQNGRLTLVFCIIEFVHLILALVDGLRRVSPELPFSDPFNKTTGWFLVIRGLNLLGLSSARLVQFFYDVGQTLACLFTDVIDTVNKGCQLFRWVHLQQQQQLVEWQIAWAVGGKCKFIHFKMPVFNCGPLYQYVKFSKAIIIQIGASTSRKIIIHWNSRWNMNGWHRIWSNSNLRMVMGQTLPSFLQL